MPTPELIGIASLFSDVFTIAVTPESGVTSLEDLDGEALGVTDLGGGEMPLVRAALDSVGLSFDDDVELTVIGAGCATARALARPWARRPRAASQARSDPSDRPTSRPAASADSVGSYEYVLHDLSGRLAIR